LPVLKVLPFRVDPRPGDVVGVPVSGSPLQLLRFFFSKASAERLFKSWGLFPRSPFPARTVCGVEISPFRKGRYSPSARMTIDPLEGLSPIYSASPLVGIDFVTASPIVRTSRKRKGSSRIACYEDVSGVAARLFLLPRDSACLFSSPPSFPLLPLLSP